MKWTLLILLAVAVSCKNRKPGPVKEDIAVAVPANDSTPKVATISFPVQDLNVGEIESGVKLKKVFKFYNTGNAPLTVTDIKTACSCTVPSWTKNAVAPGDSGKIEVVFDSKGYAGPFSKWMTVYATGSRPTAVLTIFGTVKVSTEGGPEKIH